MRYLCLFFVFWSSISSAATISKAIFDGTTLRWSSAYSIRADDHLVPSHWDIPGNTIPTSEWLPGGFFSPPPTTINLVGPGGVINVDIDLKGIQYNVGSANPTNGTVPGNICPDTFGAGGEFTVGGADQCYYDNSLVNDKITQPYSFIRPIFHIDPVDLESQLEGKDSGIYRGTVIWSNFYDYIFDSSGVYTRQINSHHLVIEIDYQGAVITDVQLVGDGIMDTIYNTQNQVSGSTQFRGSVSGRIPSGVRLSLKDTTGPYELINSGATSLIPYTVSCLGCSDSNLVVDGVVIEDQTTVNSSDGTFASFSLQVSFTDVDLSNLEEGNYSDSFSLIFEPEI